MQYHFQRPGASGRVSVVSFQSMGAGGGHWGQGGGMDAMRFSLGPGQHGAYATGPGPPTRPVHHPTTRTRDPYEQPVHEPSGRALHGTLRGTLNGTLRGPSVAALAGARVDPGILWAVLAGEIPLPEIPEFPDALDAWRRTYPLDAAARRMVEAAAGDLSDPRVRAVFQVAPGVGALVTRESLAAVRVPVGIRWGGADTVNPYEADTRPYLEHIPTASGHSAGPDVRHDDFFAPEPADPTARVRVGGEAADFFVRHLGGPAA